MIKWFKRNKSKNSLESSNNDALNLENSNNDALNQEVSKYLDTAENSIEPTLETPLELPEKLIVAPTSKDEKEQEKAQVTDFKIPTEKEAAGETKEKTSLFSRFKQSLEKTRQQLGKGISRLLLGKKEINASLLEELETLLLRADIGIPTTQAILKQLTDHLTRNQLSDGDAIYLALKNQLKTILQQCEESLNINSYRNVNDNKSPFVILMVGVNGAGKTTSIGKLAKQLQQQGKKVMLAAGDTFRAAAIEQLQVWGERNQIPVISQHTGADSASVIYDALQAAKARGYDILIADTAGRLHTQTHLMDELKKVKRVLQKIDPQAPHEVLLVLDASAGQNALNQARQFHQAIGVTGLLMTKLDGTAKGGILFAIANELHTPIRFLGTGEKIHDLRSFDADQFVTALFE